MLGLFRLTCMLCSCCSHLANTVTIDLASVLFKEIENSHKMLIRVRITRPFSWSAVLFSAPSTYCLIQLYEKEHMVFSLAALGCVCVCVWVCVCVCVGSLAGLEVWGLAVFTWTATAAHWS